MKFVLLALFGATMGQGVVWYTGQFYAMNFMKVMSIDSQSGYFIRSCFNFGTPFFVFFGWLSDKVGRKYIMMGECYWHYLLYRPIYKQMYNETIEKQNRNGRKNYGTC
jgi:MFS family permease